MHPRFTARPSIKVAIGWFADGTFDAVTDTGERTAFANLDLQVWSLVSGSFSTLVAESASTYDKEEFLRFTLPAAGVAAIVQRRGGLTPPATRG